jgi:hypothetical protein
MDRTYQIQAAYQVGGVVAPVIQGLPRRGANGPNYLTRVQGKITLVLTTTGTNTAVPGKRLWEALQSLQLKPKSGLPSINNLLGQSIRAFQWSQTRRAPLDPPMLPANAAAGTYTFYIPFTMNFADKRCSGKEDGALPLGMYADGAVNVSWVGSGYFGSGITISTATTLTLTFCYQERMQETGGEVDLGERVVFEQIGVNTFQHQPIDPGMLTDLLLAPIDGTSSKAFAENSFSAISLNADSTAVHTNTIPDDVIICYNNDMIQDSSSDLPTLDQNVTEFIPLQWPGQNGNDMGDYLYSSGKFDFFPTVGAGAPTPSNYNFLARRILKSDPSDLADQVHAAVPDVAAGTAQAGLAIANSLAPNAAHGIIRPNTNSTTALPTTSVKGAVYGQFMSRKCRTANLSAAAENKARALPVK